MDPVDQFRAALAGRYDLERELGRGGTAIVYLARDPRHDRRVAIKILDPDLAATLGADRFLAEIRTTAQLQHPNILSLFDSGEANGQLYYVMPYVAGETLRDRLDRERQLPIDEAIRIATGVAAALEHAHKQGIVHRDLKPENILLADGEPIVADFGIALALQRAKNDRFTGTGISLGTPAYMSPEQATGERQLDARSDIFSAAAVVYEMLAGQTPFAAPTAQATIARIITDRQRALSTVRPSVPAHVSAAIDKALEKLPADRWSSARDFSDAVTGRLVVSPRAAASRGNRALIIGALVLTGAIVAFVYSQRPKAMMQERGLTLRFPIVTSDSQAFIQTTPGIPFAISNDERRIVYVGGRDERRRLFVRGLDDMQTHGLAGTEDALQPVFSPDGRSISFVQAGRIARVPTEGGAVTTIAQLNGANTAGFDWVHPDTLIASVGGRLVAVPVSGAPAVVLARPDTSKLETAQWGPHVVGQRLIAYVSLASEGVSASKIGVLDRQTGKTIISQYRGTTVLGTVDGHVLWVMTNGTVMAAPLNKDGTIGSPTSVLEDVLVRPGGAAKAALSNNGSLIYHRGLLESQLVLVDQHGVATPLPANPRTYWHPRYSPDGSRIAVAVSRPSGSDIWLLDSKAGGDSRLTRGDAIYESPEWTPDGRRLIYRAVSATATTLRWRASDATDQPSQLIESVRDPYNGLLTADGRWILYRTGEITGRRQKIFYASLTGDRSERQFGAPDELQVDPRPSPDGKWVMYVTLEGGRTEVFVRPFPGPGPATQISVGGGAEGAWSRDGRTIFYRKGRTMMAASVTASPTFAVTAQRQLFDGNYLVDPSLRNYDIAPDGRFLMLRSVERQSETIVIYGWANELRRAWIK